MAMCEAAENAYHMVVMAKQLKASLPRWRQCGRESNRASIAQICNTQCRPARRATRLIARCGILRPSALDGLRTNWPGCLRPHLSQPPTPFRSPNRQPWQQAAGRAAQRALLKVKLGADGDPERIRAVRTAAPNATLIVDANEGWNEDNLATNLDACAQAGIALVEQPLPDGRDDALRRIRRVLPVCADESVHDRASLALLDGKYDAINIKLDKTGGLTEALAMLADAERRNFTIMIGCMVATSLAMAPAMLLTQRARFVDLDGPLLLSKDRSDGLLYADSLVYPPSARLWG